MPSISFYTLGCRLNQSETAAIHNRFKEEGYRIVDFHEPADIVVINTCTVTENGDADTRRLVNKVNRINPRSRIALIGCQAQMQKEKLTHLPNVRWVVGNARKMDLPEIFRDGVHLPGPEVITPTIDRAPFTLATGGADPHHTRANLKIQDGCDFFCSFCEIPYARGRARSRVFEDLLREARTLAEAGHREIVLTGINIGTYRYQDKGLLDVLAALETVEGLKRVRISSIEPTTIPAELLDRMTASSKLCRYLHIPLQSGSNDILRMMKRKYTIEEFSGFIQTAHTKIPGICIGTDIIVGFPGETEAHFEETYARLQDMPVHYFHVFSYSSRTMAKSKDLRAAVPAPVIQDRSRRLRELSQRKRRLYHQSMLDTTQDVLFEQHKNGAWDGLTDHYVRVKVPAHGDLRNQILPVRFVRLNAQNVIGELN